MEHDAPIGATKGSFHFVTQSTESCPQKSRHCSTIVHLLFFVQLVQECFMSDILTHILQCNWSLHLQALFIARTSPHCVYLPNLVYSTVLPSLMCLLTQIITAFPIGWTLRHCTCNKSLQNTFPGHCPGSRHTKE